MARATRDGGDDDDDQDHDNLSFSSDVDLFATSIDATSIINSDDEAQYYKSGDPGQSSEHEFGERIVGLLGQARQEFEVERTTINDDDELDEPSLDVANFIT